MKKMRLCFLVTVCFVLVFAATVHAGGQRDILLPGVMPGTLIPDAPLSVLEIPFDLVLRGTDFNMYGVIPPSMSEWGRKPSVSPMASQSVRYLYTKPGTERTGDPEKMENKVFFMIGSGERPSSGWSIKIHRIVRSGGEMEIHFSTQRGNGNARLTVMSHPFAVIALDKEFSKACFIPVETDGEGRVLRERKKLDMHSLELEVMHDRMLRHRGEVSRKKTNTGG